MPEGHTIHRLARDHARVLAGQAVRVSSPQGRFEAEARVLDGRVLERTEAWGKHLFHHYEDGAVVHVHLGLVGRFRTFRQPAAEARPAVRMRVEAEGHVVDLTGPMVCELLDVLTWRAVQAPLGPDPLREDADPDEAWRRLSGRRAPIGAVLLDQRVIAGLGNVYRAELLFLAGLDPRRPANTLSRATFDMLWEQARHQLQEGVRLNRIVTVDPHEAGVPRSAMRRGTGLYVYKRRTCRRCGDAVVALKVDARPCYTCPTCQPAWSR